MSKRKSELMKKEEILGFYVCAQSQTQLINNIFEDYNRNEQLFIANINPEIVVSNYRDEQFREQLNKQKYQIPDGSGIVWASKRKKGNIKERITGIDLMIKICEKSQEFSSKIFLYGGIEGMAEKAKKELEKEFPNINIVGTCDGYKEEETVLQKIKNTQIDILFVGLGSPKQEKFILDNKEKLANIRILMPVGGSFDVISKTKKRAPTWMIKINLEWLYRLMQEPKRIFRQFKLIKFMFLVLKTK